MKRKIIYPLIVLLVLLVHASYAQVWQWSVSVDSVVSGETGDHPRAYLWIPENCRRVRAVIFAQHNMIEEGMLERPLFRRTMKELGIAEVWVTPGINMPFDFNKGAGRGFDRMMQLLADRSGYAELAGVPVIPIGHSAYATFPWNFAAWAPGRTLALLSVHGDAPLTTLTGYGGANVNWGDRNIDGVPALFVMGEYEWWEDRIAPAFKYVSEHPHAAISLFCDAGHGHFDYSDEMIAYVCMFIRKAARLRLSVAAPAGGQYTLKGIDPKAGWLMDRWRKDSVPVARAAPYGAYKGDRYYSSWVFDKEMAAATERFYALSRGKRRQYIGFQQQGRVLRPDRSHAEYMAKFEPLADGVSFHLKAFFADASRTDAVRAFARTPLRIDRICGPVAKVNDTTFRVSFNRLGFDNPKRSFDIWLLAHNDGDKTFKSAVQQLNIKIPPRNDGGVEQTVRFDGIADQPAGKKAIPLHAVSSAGLPVCYYVREGPAYIDGDTLRFTGLPPRARFPVEVTVVAWQYGIAGKFRTAVPVTHSFYLIRPELVCAYYQH